MSDDVQNMGMFTVGATVKIKGLIQQPRLNGVDGEIIKAYDVATKRWGVKISHDGRELALKTANLVLVRRPWRRSDWDPKTMSNLMQPFARPGMKITPEMMELPPWIQHDGSMDPAWDLGRGTREAKKEKTTEEAIRLSVGDTVKIKSLILQHQHNGVHGEIVKAYNEATGRWGVKIATDGRELLLKTAQAAAEAEA